MTKRVLTYTLQKIPTDDDENWGDSCLSAPLDTANGDGFFEYLDTLAGAKLDDPTDPTSAIKGLEDGALADGSHEHSRIVNPGNTVQVAKSNADNDLSLQTHRLVDVASVGHSKTTARIDYSTTSVTHRGVVRFEDGGNWKDENIDVTTLTGTGTLPAKGTLTGGIVIAYFNPNTIDEVSTSVEINHDWKIGTPIYFHAHCYPANTNTGIVRIGLEYTFSQEGIALPSSTTIYAESAMPGTALTRKSITFAAITPPSEVGCQFHFRFFRDAAHVNDTYTGDVGISTIGYHYQLDSIGSDGVTTKT